MHGKPHSATYITRRGGSNSEATNRRRRMAPPPGAQPSCWPVIHSLLARLKTVLRHGCMAHHGTACETHRGGGAVQTRRGSLKAAMRAREGPPMAGTALLWTAFLAAIASSTRQNWQKLKRSPPVVLATAEERFDHLPKLGHCLPKRGQLYIVREEPHPQARGRRLAVVLPGERDEPDLPLGHHQGVGDGGLPEEDGAQLG